MLQGAALLRHPRVMPYAILPVLINLVIYYLGYHFFVDSFEGWLTGFTEKIPAWLGFIETLLVLLFKIALLLILAFTFTFAANLIGSPFYGLMAEEVEAIKNPGVEQQAFSAKELVIIIPRSILRELQKLVYYLLRVIPLLLLSALSLILPPLATLTPIIWFMFGAFMLAIQYVDYAYDNNRLAFRALAQDLKKDRSTSLGFGSACTIATMIPLLNVFTVPAAACGGTVYFVERLGNTKNN